MNLLTSALPSADWLPFFVQFTVKATLILAVAWMACALLWRSSAAVRHLVWSAGVAGVLALPLLSATLPAWHLPMLSAVALNRPQKVTAPASTRAAVEPVSATTVQSGGADTVTEGPIFAASLPQLASGLAFAGIVFGLLWLASGFWGVARLGRRAERVRDPVWLSTAETAAEQLGLRRPVLLLRSDRASMPATWGLLWPSVIVPSAADQWPDDRRQAVLSHELAHVKRFDCLTQTLAQVACILLWWNPAMWYAARRLRVERERACDDLVLAAGARPSDYATHLLEIARSHRSMYMAAPALLSMAKPSQLESRLLWVLDRACARTVPSVRATVLTLFCGLLLTAPLSAVRPGDAAVAPPKEEEAATLPFEASAPPSPRAAASLHQVARVETAQPPPVQMPEAAPASQASGKGSMEELVLLQSAGVDGAYIDELRTAGYTGLDGSQLAAMKGTGVSAAYIEEMNSAGFGRLPPEQLVSVKAVGVRSAYIAELQRQGLTSLSLHQIKRLQAAGVTGEYIAEMKQLGLGPLSPETLVDLHSVGITPAVVRELTGKGFGPLSPDKLVRLRTERE
jgi:beta-lactamase regulating signal transducer with metallopeptidase domain